ncbi:MAG: NAD(P)H-dependent oxidoreductase subunit E [Clostridiales bacterium]|jgi:NADP-reducing hydrogenase subunit HndA|nr:NAD(P)H-dependent oxidoreductase subunit E [Clostridiales bacterium]
MTNKKTKVPFQGTQEQEQKLLDVITEISGTKGALISVLQKAQDIYGYLPLEVQKIISEKMNIPLEEIYGVASFYAQFSLNPKGEYKISCCLGTACYVRGAGKFYEKISNELGIKTGEVTPDGKFSLEACRCIGACGLAPVMTINEDVYGRLTEEEVDKILAKY